MMPACVVFISSIDKGLFPLALEPPPYFLILSAMKNVWLGFCDPSLKIYNFVKKIIKNNLHSVDPLSRRLGLSTPKALLLVLVDQSIGQRAVRHSVLVHSILLKIRHHIS